MNYVPKTELGRKLLHSIPRKTYLWLKSLGIDVNEPGLHGLDNRQLAWHFDETAHRGMVVLTGDGVTLASIQWDLDLADAAGTFSTVELQEPLELRLDEFVRIEHYIYEILTDLDAKLRRLRNVKVD